MERRNIKDQQLLDAATNGLKYVIANLQVLGANSEEDPGKVLDWLKKLPDSITAIEKLQDLVDGVVKEEESTVQGGYELNPFELPNRK